MNTLTTEVVTLVRSIYATDGFVPLHAPLIGSLEKQYLLNCIDSKFVSSVGEYVTQFEEEIASYCNVQRAVAVVNGTAGLTVALKLGGVGYGDLVLTQSLTFVATSNAISHVGANPVFCDIDTETLGLCPAAVLEFLEKECEKTASGVCHKDTGRFIRAIVPVHIFGHCAKVDELSRIAAEWGLFLVEDSAEGLGSFRNDRHAGTFGDIGVLSFNGNKTITTGGGGALLLRSPELAAKAKHLTTTAKKNHPWSYEHDEIAYNFRMPNLNAALGCAQMERLPALLKDKIEIAGVYRDWCQQKGIRFLDQPNSCRSNFWLNAIFLEDSVARDHFLELTNQAGVMTRPVWRPMHQLSMYRHCVRQALPVTENAAARLVNLPSSGRNQ